MTDLFSLFSCDSRLQCAEKINKIMCLIGLETDVSQLGLASEGDIDFIVNLTNLERLSNNAVAVSNNILKFVVGSNYRELRDTL